MTTTELDLETLLPWTAPKEVHTKAGKRYLRTATPSEAFWAAWKSDKQALKDAGIGCGEWPKGSGKWVANWWTRPSAEEVAKENAAIEASRATDADIDVPVPQGLEYLPFQRAGIAYVKSNFDRGDNAMIGDDLGLGKSIQAVGVINLMPSLKRILVICPATVKINWKIELDRWLVQKRQVEIFDGKTFNPQAEIGVINYDNISKHDFPEYDLLISDEAHYCSNSATRRAKAWKNIKAKHKLVLTGTPMLNRTKELFNILNHLDPVYYKNFFKFGMRYCAGHQIRVILPPHKEWNPKTRKHEMVEGGPSMVWDFSGNSNGESLQREMRSSLMIRRLKSEVLSELPPKRRQIIQLPNDTCKSLLAEEKSIYTDRVAILEKLQQQLELAKVMEDNAAYMRAAEELKTANTVLFESMAKVRKEIGLKTVPFAIEHLGNIMEEGKKVLCFCHHTDVIQAIAEAFPNHAMITGSTSATVRLENGKQTNDRQKEVEKFQNDPTCLLFIGQDQAAAEGITLTAASNVVFVETLWNPGKTDQCESRAHRLGQKESVLIQFLVIAGSVNAYMMETTVSKMNAIDKVLDRMTHDAALAEPCAPVKTVTITKQELDEQAKTITDEQRAAIHTCLKILAGLDSDYAAQRNGVGFSGADSYIGHSLAESAYLSPKQCVLGRKVTTKYWKQLPPDLYKSATGKTSKLEEL